MSDALKSREQLFMESFERKEAVCSHLHQATLIGRTDFHAYPLCIQVYEDGYDLYWYCDQCVESYRLSPCGTYVYDAEDDLQSALENLQDFELSSDEDINPFSEFLEQESGHLIENRQLSEFNLNFDIEKPLENGKPIKIPFGSMRVDRGRT